MATLFEACESGDVERVKALLDAGAKVDPGYVVSLFFIE
jgi:hypothetical protein